MKNVLIAIAAVIVICSCIPLPTHRERMTYPTKWSPLSTNTSCDALTGKYLLVGENAQHSSNRVNSPTLFGLFRRTVDRNRTFVEVSYSSATNEVVLTAMGDGGQDIVREPVECEAGSLIHHSKSEGWGDGTYSSADFTLALTRATDGSLVAHVVGGTRSRDALFEWSGEYDGLYRFRPAPSNP